jgi:tRNA(His) guanylyltransferase
LRLCVKKQVSRKGAKKPDYDTRKIRDGFASKDSVFGLGYSQYHLRSGWVFETAHDRSVLPGMFLVARIDGRNFTRLTKETHNFEAPYDARFRDMMIETTSHLMNCGFNAIYGYTQSDEISLLFHPSITTFDRKVRKYNSILAGEASAKFSLLLQDLACFDCRISELPNVDLVVDYFRWRNEDARRNALNAHCYWLLRKEAKRSNKPRPH